MKVAADPPVPIVLRVARFRSMCYEIGLVTYKEAHS